MARQELNRYFEDVALRLASAQGGVSALAMAARVPLAPLQTVGLLDDMVLRALLRAGEKDDIRFYLADGKEVSPSSCPRCESPLAESDPLCPECSSAMAALACKSQHEADRILAEHDTLGALSDAKGADVTLATLAAAGPLTSKETETLLVAISGRLAVAVSSDPTRVAWRPPLFEAPPAWRLAHRKALQTAVKVERDSSLTRRVLGRYRLILVGLVLLYVLVTAGGYLHARAARKAAANAYWQTFFSVKEHEALLSRYVDRVPGLDVNRTLQELDSMADLDVVTRLRRDRHIHDQVKQTLQKAGENPEAKDVLRSLEEFEHRFAAQRAEYDKLAIAHHEAAESLPGRMAGFFFKVRVIYDPLPEDVWEP